MTVEKLHNKVKYSDVKPGQVFEWCDCFYIKPECTAVLLKDIDGLASINAIGLNRGVFTHFNEDDEVILHDNAKVVLI